MAMTGHCSASAHGDGERGRGGLLAGFGFPAGPPPMLHRMSRNSPLFWPALVLGLGWGTALAFSPPRLLPPAFARQEVRLPDGTLLRLVSARYGTQHFDPSAPSGNDSWRSCLRVRCRGPGPALMPHAPGQTRTKNVGRKSGRWATHIPVKRSSLPGWFPAALVFLALGGVGCGAPDSTPAALSGSAAARPYPLEVCLVSDEKLGSMGDPVVLVHEGQQVKFCCDHCTPKFQKDPAKYLAKLNQK